MPNPAPHNHHGARAADEERQATRRRSLLQPLQHLAGDFRKRVRTGLRTRGHRIQPAHASVIVHLRTEGSRLTALAQRAGMSKQAMGKLVDELEALGYVERLADPADGRAKLVRFRRPGLVFLADAGEIVAEIWKHYAAQIGERRLRRLRADLVDLVAHLEEGA